ncbi:hypothetical protein ACFXGA_01925 [Actinosynnema sp. NPDC059335]|uniref:hypothetical protein n=1 Tax=Actinosynnema sp. NPDC059335 TaxID=3346804 RepID=UPI003671A1B3
MTGSPVLESVRVVPRPDADPLRPLEVAGLGWLVEHVAPLREPVAWLAGQGDRFAEAVATWRQVATTLDGIARRRPGGRLTAEIAATGRVCRAVAAHLAEVAAITAAIRAVLLEVVALFVEEVLANAAVALAASDLTGGGSRSDFAAWAVGRGAVVLDRVTRRLAELAPVVVRVLRVLKALFGRARDVVQTITRCGG